MTPTLSAETAELDQRERSAQFVWMSVIIGFFVVQAIIWAIAITLTSNDDSHAVVADYDEKALHWDEQLAQQKSSEALGWRSEIVVDPTSDIRGVHAIALSLSDREQTPVAGAVIELFAFHRGHAGERQRIELVELSPGIYTGQIKIRKSGRWQFDGLVRESHNTFIIDACQSLKRN